MIALRRLRPGPDQELAAQVSLVGLPPWQPEQARALAPRAAWVRDAPAAVLQVARLAACRVVSGQPARTTLPVLPVLPVLIAPTPPDQPR